ncbi:hypothetical protein [Streptomyces sp. NPDC048637]|uniref:WXG100-like domain-containing protein n=1 Tax=Streptomyces sp. NPDC048637 TaxID=3155636 RepID=UPI003440265E
MGVVLPGWADEVLDIIGVSWPNVDEDDYRETATAMREFADDIDEGANEARTAIQGLVGSAGGSLAVEALNAHWGKINGQHLKGLADCGRMAATAMDGVAVLIEGAKIGALVQLGILAAEVIAAQVAAPFTLARPPGTDRRTQPANLCSQPARSDGSSRLGSWADASRPGRDWTRRSTQPLVALTASFTKERPILVTTKSSLHGMREKGDSSRVSRSTP